MINNFDSFHICSTIKQIFKSDRKIYFNQLKKIPHREIEDKFLFDIKKEWKEVKISSLFDFHHFKSIPKKIRKGGKIPFIGVSKNDNGISEYVLPVKGYNVVDYIGALLSERKGT